MTESQQAETIADILTEMSLDGEFVIIDDQGGAYNDAGSYPAALDAISRAIERTDNILPPYFIRADILVQMTDIAGAERDRDKIDELLQRQGGFSEGDEVKLLDLTIRLLIERHQFKAAKDKIELTNFLPHRLRQRLLRDLARAIGFVPQSATREMAAWAKSFREKK